MVIRKRKYTTETSDLVIDVIAVPYQNDRYAKVKLRLYNKHNGIEYDTRPRYYKVFKERITHWVPYILAQQTNRPTTRPI